MKIKRIYKNPGDFTVFEVELDVLDGNGNPIIHNVFVNTTGKTDDQIITEIKSSVTTEQNKYKSLDELKARLEGEQL